jgi:hypothetical protein
VETPEKEFTISNLFEELKAGKFSAEDPEKTFLYLLNWEITLASHEPEPEYFGDQARGIPEGIGVMIYGQWELYVGEWHKGKRHGKGFMVYSLHQRYAGDWVDDQRNGYGITTFRKPSRTFLDGAWKGQYVDDRWEGEDAHEARKGQQFPTTMHFGSDVRTAMERFYDTTEKVGNLKEASRIRSRIEALDNLERAFQAGWGVFAYRYPKKFPELNRIVCVTHSGIGCLICRDHVDPSEKEKESPVERVFDLTLAKERAEDEALGRRLEFWQRLNESGFDQRDDAYYNLDQQERFVQQYQKYPGRMRQHFLTNYAEGRISVIDQHLREVHDWKIAKGISPDIKLDFRFSGFSIL